MPRQERLQSATGIYHVMLRGINKQDIFEDDGDYLQTELHSQVIEGVWCGNTPALSIDRCLLWSYTEVMKKEKMITEPSNRPLVILVIKFLPFLGFFLMSPHIQIPGTTFKNFMKKHPKVWKLVLYLVPLPPNEL